MPQFPYDGLGTFLKSCHDVISYRTVCIIYVKVLYLCISASLQQALVKTVAVLQKRRNVVNALANDLWDVIWQLVPYLRFATVFYWDALRTFLRRSHDVMELLYNLCDRCNICAYHPSSTDQVQFYQAQTSTSFLSFFISVVSSHGTKKKSLLFSLLLCREKKIKVPLFFFLEK